MIKYKTRAETYLLSEKCPTFYRPIGVLYNSDCDLITAVVANYALYVPLEIDFPEHGTEAIPLNEVIKTSPDTTWFYIDDVCCENTNE